MPMTRTTISFTRERMELIREAAKRQGASVSQFVRKAALMRAAMAAGHSPYRTRARSPHNCGRLAIRATRSQRTRCKSPRRRLSESSDA
jgi:hypothetical protein